VAGEMALTLVVVVCATLLIRSFSRLLDTDPGFEARDVLTMKLSLTESEYGNPVALENISRRLLQSIESLPGVRDAAVAMSLPFEMGWDLPFIIDGRYDEGTGEGWGVAQYRGVSPGFFESLGIQLQKGRAFQERDSSEAPSVVIINRAAVRRYWPDEDPIGRRITIGPPEFPDVAPPRTVIGVVGDVKERGLESQAPEIVYVPLSQLPERWASGLDVLDLVIKSDSDTDTLVRAVQDEIWAYDPGLPVMNVRSMEGLVARSVGSREFNTLLMTVFAGLALLLAAVGIYAVLSYIVGQRTHEIGLRMALGASRKDVMALVLGELMPVMFVGLCFGVGGALALNRFLSAVLFGVSSTDPTTFIGVSLALAAVALTAGYIPARRATQVEPITALRHE
jgi:predicted permease